MSIIEKVKAIPRRVEEISGQSFSYVKLEEVLSAIECHSIPYPREEPIQRRFLLKSGKFGDYFHDRETEYDMPLIAVMDTLNRAQLRKLQLKWMIENYGEPNDKS